MRDPNYAPGWQILLTLTLITTLGLLSAPARAQTAVSITAHFVENTRE